MITNVYLLANSSNHKAVFLEYLKNIQRISVSKIFQGYSQNIVSLWKYFYEVKKFQKLVVSYRVEFLILAVSSLLKCLSELYWNWFSLTTKSLEQCCEKICINAWYLEKIKISTDYSIRFLTSCNLTTCYNIYLIAVIAVANHYQQELSTLSATGHLPAQSQQ